MLPGITTHATCIRFNPYLYKKENIGKEGVLTPLIDLPYRIVFAVGTLDQVIIYTTESIYPIAVIGNIHFATINDMSWKSNE